MYTMSQDKNGQRKEKRPAKNKQVIVLPIKVAFWVPIYLKTMALFCWTFGTQPDAQKVKETLKKGVLIGRCQSHKRKGVKRVLGRLLFPFSRIGGRG
ncbi:MULTISPECIES: hypothetical protein [unclassified Vibrio]|uniref:hypothetical protein n=1 Tax=unclassified Vibrio TaxID=2614977 RepID=UPI001929D9F3|nr:MULTISPECIES: hypothetical protein [unclassified Vibrio]